MTRLCSDAYGRGIVRSNQESINLRVTGVDADVTSAESFHTSSFVNFPGQDVCKWREATFEAADYVEMISAIAVEWRNPHRRTPVMRNLVFLYGHRPKWPRDLWFSSLYEFMVHWTVQLAEYSLHPDIDDDTYHARLTVRGKERLANRRGRQLPELKAGTHYVIKEREEHSPEIWWVPLPKNAYTE